MTEVTPLRARARAAYERGRRRRALGEGAGAALLALAAISWGTPLAATLFTAASLGIAVGLLRFHGGCLGRAAWMGLLAGIVPLALPLALHRSGLCCIGGMPCDSVCLAACVGGGVLAGAIVGARAIAAEPAPVRFAGAAGLVALLVGSLGCFVSGVAGVVGLAATLCVSALPIAFAREQAAGR